MKEFIVVVLLMVEMVEVMMVVMAEVVGRMAAAPAVMVVQWNPINPATNGQKYLALLLGWPY